MSGVYIKGMEMPGNCFLCQLSYLRGERLFCYLTKDEVVRVKRAQDCPLVAVPDHGDLIDRDIYRASIRESLEECNKWANEVDNDTMMYARISQSVGTFVECSLRAKSMPTVIPKDW